MVQLNTNDTFINLVEYMQYICDQFLIIRVDTCYDIKPLFDYVKYRIVFTHPKTDDAPINE